MRFDGASPLARGTPVFACDGKLVAMREWDELIAGSKIRDLKPAPQPIDDASWSLAHLHVGMLLQADSDRPWIGLGTGLGLVYADRLQLRLGFGALAGIPRKEEQPPDESRGMARLQLEPTLGWRFLLSESFPTYVVPQIGGIARADFLSTATSAYSAADPACFAAGRGPCPIDRRTERKNSTSFGFAPAFGVSFLFAVAGVSYQMQLDVDEPRRSTHQWFIGVEF
jgi:hypothetical protein